MREFAKVAPRFWTGETGRVIRNQGTDALVVALYLMTGPHANMIGLYYLPIPFICHETGLPQNRVNSAIGGLIACGFLRHDPERELVWVRQMAHFQVGPSLKATDKRVTGIHTLLKSIPSSPLVQQFIHYYRRPFRFGKQTGEGELNTGHGSDDRRLDCNRPHKKHGSGKRAEAKKDAPGTEPIGHGRHEPSNPEPQQNPSGHDPRRPLQEKASERTRNNPTTGAGRERHPKTSLVARNRAALEKRRG